LTKENKINLLFGITCSAQCTPGGINAFINDKLSDESIYEDVDKLMKVDLHNKIYWLEMFETPHVAS